MYSGSTFTVISGRVMGAHQKIDRVARLHLQRLVPKVQFPAIRTILHFEGGNGPDSIKRKSPAKNEPWHYFQPFDESDTQLLVQIQDHYLALVKSLKDKDDVRAGFEAAWLAHAVVDGLTPAHHYPYEEKLVELMSGKGIETRTTIKHKLVMPGNNRVHQIKNNWKMWGPKGLFVTHSAFELGFATLIAPMRLYRAMPSAEILMAFERLPLDVWYRQVAQDIASSHFYDSFYKTGWTLPLARRVRRQLAPKIVQAVTLIWYRAANEASSSK